MSGPRTSEWVAQSWRTIQVVAHRGASADEPENTLPAFELALVHGAPAVECDVRLSRDGVAVVVHDETLDRTTKLSGPVDGADWTDLEKAGVPSFEQVARLTKDRAILIAEIKSSQGAEPLVVECLRTLGMVGQAILFAFDERVLLRSLLLEPSLFAVRLLGPSENPSADALDRLIAIGVRGVGVSYERCTNAVIAEARLRGLPVFTWTVPPGPEVVRLKNLGANFIITNHPKEVLAQLRTIQPV